MISSPPSPPPRYDERWRTLHAHLWTATIFALPDLIVYFCVFYEVRLSVTILRLLNPTILLLESNPRNSIVLFFFLDRSVTGPIAGAKRHGWGMYRHV